MKSDMKCWTDSVLLEACKFFETFISLINSVTDRYLKAVQLCT